MAEQATATSPSSSATEGPRPAAAAAPGPAPRGLMLGLTGRQLLGVAAVVVAAQLPFLIYFARGETEVVASIPFSDDFNRSEIGSSYFSTGGHWRIEDGVLHSPGVKNNPLWLKARLPDDAVVEFDVKSSSSDGDVKCEIFGDGRDHASGYVVVFGGWSNSTSVLARLDEHGRDRKESRGLRAEKGRLYHFRIERKGTLLRWLADGQLMMEYDDPEPLRGRGHDRFGFSSWDSDLYFDNLTIRPL
jgi:hypothetical protein